MTASEAGNWVPSRQFTGRVVTVSNSVIFDEAVYNYTRGFPFLWEEISVNLPFEVDLRLVDELFVSCADGEYALDEPRVCGRCPRVRAAGIRLP